MKGPNEAIDSREDPLTIAVHHGRLCERASGADIVGDDLDGTIEHSVAGKPEDELDAVCGQSILSGRPA
jgi:hypothetical protein